MVGVSGSRSGVEISWVPGDYVGPVRIKAVNVENGDVGVVKDTNDGFHFLTWPEGTWTDHIQVFQDDDTETLIDEGTVTVTVSDRTPDTTS